MIVYKKKKKDIIYLEKLFEFSYFLMKIPATAKISCNTFYLPTCNWIIIYTKRDFVWKKSDA